MARTSSLVLAGLLLSAAAPSIAATVVVTSTADLSTASTTAVSASVGGSLASAFSVAEGDTFDFTMDFLGNQSITLADPQFFWGYAFAEPASQFAATGTFSLLDSTGAAILTSLGKSSVEGDNHLGQKFVAADFAALPASVTFYGIRYLGLVTDYTAAGVTTRNHFAPVLTVAGASASVDTAVPEPASWAFMTIGFGAIGAAIRARPRARRTLTA